ncbi:MAG: 4-hydroxy-3-methylbut-2-enyl diphosphate reductase [Candidatus Caenarcaniphilales bacterium]|nr:4-hydroxy-3-methylbut-2-enyl diphosphate reductase [Candidatus Caenarcaniphilales bacterium]
MKKPKQIILASPRGFCAGVDRAIEIVDKALDIYDAPIYVRHEIVHNHHVVNDFKNRGVIFIEDLNEVPDSAKLIFSAHGTDPAVIESARARGIFFIDAVCPLVTKVHKEIKKAVDNNKKIIYIGHKGHQEVVGAMGYARDEIHLVESASDLNSLALNPETALVVCTQTTLSVDDTAEIINAIKSKFSNVEFPKADDICYATQNRQDAVKELINKCDHILIIGSNNSSNTLRLVELVDKAGKAVNLISDPESFVPEESIENIEDSVIGISSGASAPEKLIEQLISKLIGTSDYKTSELIQTLEVIEEKTHFPLPEPLNC